MSRDFYTHRDEEYADIDGFRHPLTGFPVGLGADRKESPPAAPTPDAARAAVKLAQRMGALYTMAGMLQAQIAGTMDEAGRTIDAVIQSVGAAPARTHSDRNRNPGAAYPLLAAEGPQEEEGPGQTTSR